MPGTGPGQGEFERGRASLLAPGSRLPRRAAQHVAQTDRNNIVFAIPTRAALAVTRSSPNAKSARSRPNNPRAKIVAPSVSTLAASARHFLMKRSVNHFTFSGGPFSFFSQSGAGFRKYDSWRSVTTSAMESNSRSAPNISLKKSGKL